MRRLAQWAHAVLVILRACAQDFGFSVSSITRLQTYVLRNFARERHVGKQVCDWFHQHAKGHRMKKYVFFRDQYGFFLFGISGNTMTLACSILSWCLLSSSCQSSCRVAVFQLSRCSCACVISDIVIVYFEDLDVVFSCLQGRILLACFCIILLTCLTFLFGRLLM